MDGKNWRHLFAICGAASLGFVAACSDDGTEDTGVTPDGGTTDTGVHADGGNGDTGVGDSGPEADAGFIRVNFTIDDSANQVYDQAAGLAWKGSFAFDSATRILTKTGWTGPFANVFDDGPVSAGGHEPEGSTAGDHKWGIETLVAKPSADEMYDYGAISGSVDGSDGAWIWGLAHDMNGTFTVPADSDAPITVEGLVLPAFGTTDLRLEIDTSTLAPEFPNFDPLNGITVKGGNWAWAEQVAVDDGMAADRVAGDGIFTFRLSDFVGAGTALPYSGLLKSGDMPEWVVVLGGLEYKVANVAVAQGVTAAVKDAAAQDWTELPIGHAANNNTIVTVP